MRHIDRDSLWRTVLLVPLCQPLQLRCCWLLSCCRLLRRWHGRLLHAQLLAGRTNGSPQRVSEKWSRLHSIRLSAGRSARHHSSTRQPQLVRDAKVVGLALPGVLLRRLGAHECDTGHLPQGHLELVSIRDVRLVAQQRGRHASLLQRKWNCAATVATDSRETVEVLRLVGEVMFLVYRKLSNTVLIVF